MESVKIKIFASNDWSMRIAMQEFVKFADPIIRHKNKEYKIELGRIRAEPLLCGSNVSDTADVIIDRTIHWNAFYKCWAQTAQNSLVPIANNSLTNDNLDKHSTYDLMARAIHPADYFPKTVLLPEFSPYTADQKNEDLWRFQQNTIARNTKYGWDPARKEVDQEKIQKALGRVGTSLEKSRKIREQFYPNHNYIADVMEKEFGNRFPVFLKKAFGGGGSDVYKVNSLQELYERYDQTGGRVFHIQEAVENYDTFVRCMGIGPEVHPMVFQPDEPLHQHYSPDILRLPKDIYERIRSYVLFVNSYHRWTYNSFECLVKDGKVHPIDFANACPDSNFTSLHTHFPWLITALVRWLSFVGVVTRDLSIDPEQEKYLKVLNDPKKTPLEKFDFHKSMSDKYFQTEKYQEFVAKNFSDLPQKMIAFYDERFDGILQFAIEHSDFPEHEKSQFYKYYKNMMDTMFRPQAMDYLKTVVF